MRMVRCRGHNVMDNPGKVGLSDPPLRGRLTGFATYLTCGQSAMPRLTCITTTFNEGPALLPSVRSVLTQSFGDFQYIIVDDGSFEETRSVLDTLDDPRVMVIKQANDGLSGARNKALEQATGDYVCFLDADDIRPNWSFAAINRMLDAHNPDILLCPGVLQDLRGEITRFYDTKIFDEIYQVCPGRVTSRGAPEFAKVHSLAQRIEPQSANKVVRREFLRANGVGFPNTHFFEDIYFHTSAVTAADRIAFLNTPAFAYFRRYLKPQITASAGDQRFDIIAVSKLTLERFSRRSEFHDPAHRVAVMASCLKIIKWCESTIALQHRGAFRECARIMLRLIDQSYLDFPANYDAGAAPADAVGIYLANLIRAV